MKYQKADFGILRDTGYGIGVHWTTWTAPRQGPVKPFPQAVEEFDVERFADQAAEAGAGHVLFTANHALHWLPCPNPEVDRILPGRTCQRDLLMELADTLETRNIKLMLYYHHGTDDVSRDDPEWFDACGAGRKDQTQFYDNYRKIIQWMGEHYGTKVIAFWFDAGYALLRRGTPPWDQMTAAAKAGFEDRLVCYNSGIENHESYTPYQDYWAGEINRLNYVPRDKETPAGFPWYAFVSWHAHNTLSMCGEWGISEQSRNIDWPPPAVESVELFLRRFQQCDGTVTFNLLCYQEGTFYDSDLKLMKKLRRRFLL